MNAARIRQNADKVQLVLDGRLHEMPWQAALDISRALAQKARLAESYEKHALIVADSALLIRAGAPFGLAPTARHLAEAKKEARWGSWLRRYLPWGVRSAEAFGTPRIIPHHQRTKP